MVNTVPQWCAIALPPMAKARVAVSFSQGALADELPLELREAGQQMQVQPPLWRGGVQRLAHTDQPDAGDGEQGQQNAQIPNTAAEAVEPVYDHAIDLVGLHIV